MNVWVMILTHTIGLGSVQVIAAHEQFLFENKAACEEVRPLLLAKTRSFAPTGFNTPLAAKLTECMEQRVMSAKEFRQELESRP